MGFDLSLDLRHGERQKDALCIGISECIYPYDRTVARDKWTTGVSRIDLRIVLNPLSICAFFLRVFADCSGCHDEVKVAEFELCSDI